MTIPLLLADPNDFGNAPGQGPLRAGGTASAPLDKQDLPSQLSDAAKKQRAALEIVRDMELGPAKILERGPVYLPKAPGESMENYRVRLSRAVFFNVFGHTIKALTGFVFRKDPKLGDDVPVQIAGTETSPGHWENIDLAGTHGDVFLREIFQDALVAGHAAILVEFPATDGLQSAADERELRPYWVPIRKDNIISWRLANEAGRTVLAQLVLKEEQYVPAGLFSEKLQTRYRVMYRQPFGLDGPSVGYRLLEVTKDNGVIVIDAGYYRNQTEIPLAEIITSGRRSMFESDPPLLDLAFLNLAHYRQWSDFDTSIHKTCVPIFVTTGEQNQWMDGEGKQHVLSADDGLALPMGADAKYVSHDGAALASCKASLDDLKADMATLGLAMLTPQKQAAETAAAKRIDKASSDSQLATTARGLQDGAERALGFHSRYLLLSDGGSLEINREFESMVMDSPVMSAYAELVTAGFPKDVAVVMLQRGGRVPEDRDPEEIAMEWDAAISAIEEQKRIEAEAQNDALVAQPEGKKKVGPVNIEYDANGRPSRLVQEN